MRGHHVSIGYMERFLNLMTKLKEGGGKFTKFRGVRIGQNELSLIEVNINKI